MTRKILVVDDDDNIRRLVNLSLMGEDFEFHEASDGEEAVAVALKIQPDLILLDIMIPKKIGYEVCKEIKENPRTKNAHIIFISARLSNNAENACAMSGGDDFIAKPFEVSELREKVNKAFKPA